MAVMEQSLGTLTNFSGATRLNSLPHGKCRIIGKVSWAANEYPNAKMHLGIDFSGVSPQDGGSVDVYLISSLNNYYWSGGVTPHLALTGASAVNARKRSQMKLIRSITVDNSFSDTSLVWVCNDLHLEGDPRIGDLPEYWGVAVFNQSGCTFPSSGHYFQYQSVSYET